MAQFIEASSDDAGLMLFSGNKTASVVSMLKNSVDAFVNSMGADNSIAKRVLSTFNDMNSGDTFKRLQRIKGLLEFDSDSDEIVRLTTLMQLEQASDRMKRWIMAHPTVRSKYVNGDIEGYGDNYLSVQTEGLGADFYDYRRATNGIVMKEIIKPASKDTAETVRLSATTFFEELIDDDLMLTTSEQFDIAQTWDTIDSVFSDNADIDFTSIGNDDLEAEYLTI